MKSRCVWFWSSCAVLVLLLPQRSLQDLSATERDLYVKLEDALINDPATLEQLREVLLQTPKPTAINFHVNVTVTSMSTANNCTRSCDTVWWWWWWWGWWQGCVPAFCQINKASSSDNTVAQWEICSEIDISWTAPNRASAIIKSFAIGIVTLWGHAASLLVVHFTSYIYYDAYNYYLYNNHGPTKNITISVKELDCHPYLYQLLGSLGELFSWIEVYTEAGGKPQTWDSSKQAIVNTDGYGVDPIRDNIQKASSVILIFQFVGNFLLLFSLLLVIPRVFLVYHSKLVEQITSTGSWSLYWGMATVSMFLAIAISLSRVILFSLSFTYSEIYLEVYNPMINTHEGLVLIVFFVTAIIASRKCKTVPIPAAQYTMNILFCCCFCFCCSPRCKSTAVQALVLWSFMTVIYYHITEAIALFFALFLSVGLTVSYTLMYVSGVFFTTMLVSNIFFTCLSTNVSSRKRKCCFAVIDVCAMLFTYSIVALVFITFILVYPILNQFKLQGVETVLLHFSIIPSLALTVAGWLFKRKLLQKDTQRQTGTGHRQRVSDDEEPLLHRAGESREDLSATDTGEDELTA